ncbi:MAG TPA: TonB-dependent receptor [Polyangiaceae bacterium]
MARSSTEVPYPEGAEGDALVVLELIVAKDGTVTTVEVLEGAEPFAGHAKTAALGWSFEPARRGDEVVTARIRARVAFRAPAADTEAEPESARGAGAPAEEGAPPAATPPAASPPAEVTVIGQRGELGRTTLSAAEVREMPGAFGDPLRAIEVLPSVAPMLSGVPYFYVRGAPPNNVGFFLDGIRVPTLFHVGLGPGVIHPALLDRIDFYPGTPPASLGGVTGAIVSGQTRAPAKKAHGEASLRLVDASALLESPFAAERGTALVAGRYGYPGPIVSAFSDTTLSYWDYQSRVTYRVGEHDAIGLLVFGSHDVLGQKNSLESSVQELAIDFHRVDLRYDRVWTSGRVRFGATLGYDSQGSDPTTLTNRSAALRFELEQTLVSGLRLRSGLEGRIDAYGFSQGTPSDPRQGVVPSSAYPPRTNLTPSAHADVVWQITPRVELVPGARVTIFDSTRDEVPGDPSPRRTTVAAVDPRMALRLGVTPRVALLSGFGLTHQYPTLRVGDLPAMFGAGAGFPDGSNELQRVFQASQAVEVALPGRVVATATGFFSRSSGLTDLTQSCLQIEPPYVPPNEGPPPENPYYCPSNAQVRGHAYGLELLVRRSFTERLSGLLSYTLSRSVREGHFLTLDGSEATHTVPSDFDRTHVLNAVLAYHLGRHWRTGGRFVFYTGVPYSRLTGSVPAPPYNAFRDPAFYRVDVRLEKRWPLAYGRSIAFVFEAINVTLQKEANTLGMDCRGDLTPDGYTTECVRGEVGPLTIPSVGVEAVF